MGGGQPAQRPRPALATGSLKAICLWQNGVTMNDTKLIEALSNASSLELYELSRIIDRLLADPRRIVAIRSRLNLGKSVQFMDWRTGQMRTGKVIAMKDAQVTVQDDASRTQWKLSYAAIDPGERQELVETPTASPAQPQVAKLGPKDFRRGDRVSFTDKYLQPQIGTITRINQRTASVECDDGPGWRVPYGMLAHVMDI